MQTALLFFVYAFLVVVSLYFFAVAMTSIWWQAHAWSTPQAHQSIAYPVADTPLLSFSLIMPCRDEPEDVMRATLERLLTQSHPRLEVIISLAEDDPTTIDIARRLASEDHRVNVSITPMEAPGQGKPRQLNYALAMCSGHIVGIFDAESLAAPHLLRHVDAVFRTHSADVVQGSVQLINHQDSFVALRSALEYYFYFRSRLHAQAIRGFIPLGGNTVFIRRALLVEVGGWDVDCLAEDCELGVRLSTLKHRVSVAFDPGLTTLEEAPVTIKSWVKQRTRWNLGFLQVYRKGMWRQLPSARQRALARWTLMQPFSMAIAGVMIPTAIVMALLLSPPLWVTMIAFLPAFPTLLIIAMENVALYEYSMEFERRVRLREYARLTMTTPVYQLMAGWAALQASHKYLRRDFRWAKTTHSGRALRVLESSTVRQSQYADVTAVPDAGGMPGGEALWAPRHN